MVSSAAVRPRSSSLSMASSGQPSWWARAPRAYCKRRFLMAQHLMRCRLSDVNDSLAGQMLGRNEVGIVHRSPSWRSAVRSCGYGLQAGRGESVPELGWVAGQAAPRIFASERNELGYGMRGKFSERLGLCGGVTQPGGRLGIRRPWCRGRRRRYAHTVRARAGRDQRKRRPKSDAPGL